jgi:hypothetical protein
MAAHPGCYRVGSCFVPFVGTLCLPLCFLLHILIFIELLLFLDKSTTDNRVQLWTHKPLRPSTKVACHKEQRKLAEPS